MTRLRMLTALLAACLVLGGTAEGQEPRAMTLVDLLEAPRLSDPQLSPDGRQLLYVLAEADWEANRAISHIWRADADGGDTVQLTRGEEGETAPRSVGRRAASRWRSSPRAARRRSRRYTC